MRDVWTSWWTFVDVVPSVSCVCGVTCPVCVGLCAVEWVVESAECWFCLDRPAAVPLPEKYICELGDAGV